MQSRLLIASTLAAICLVAAIQLIHVDELLAADRPFTAGYAKALVAGYATAVGGACLLSLVLPMRRLPVLVGSCASSAALAVLATLSLGTEVWSFASAALVMAACWRVGWWSLRSLRLDRLAAIWPAAWLTGSAVLGLILLFVGRAGLLRWWTVAVPVLLVGASALAQVPAWVQATTAGWRRATSDRIGAAAACVVVLLAGLASIWTAAPELMYDPLYAKVWLPSEWARIGAIEPLTAHAALNTTGFAQILALPGHLVGAPGIGRYLQWLCAFGVVVTVWWACRRSRWAPIAAAAVAVTPQLFWQSTTAFDDAVLVLAALGLVLAVVASLEPPAPRPLLAGAAIGFMAGACVDLKLHLAALALGIAIGWLWARGREGTAAALAGVSFGGAAAAAPPLILRWIDVGNPIHPAWNNVFKSDLWPARNEQFNMPFMRDPGPLGPLDALWATFVRPLDVSEAASVGSAGLLTAALVVGLLFCLRRRDRALAAIWCGCALAAVAWYVQFRYLRYLLPAGVVALVLVTLSLPAGRGGSRVVAGAVVATAAMAILMWPSTVGMFWNVPGRDIPWEAAFHRISDREYETRAMPERPLLEAFDRVAPPGANAVGDAHQRLWLTDGRDLTPPWEALARLEASGGVPAPGRGLTRMRALGIEWLVAAPGGATLQQPYFRALVERRGELVAEEVGWQLYRIRERAGASRDR